MKRITTLLGALLLVLCFGAGQAVAADGGGAAQTAGQSAPSGQTADGASSAYQAGPSNSAGSIRVLSPGNGGAVSQSNNTTAAAIAANANKTNQSTSQSQTGGFPGSDYTQIAGQEAQNKQDADADANAVQIAPSNSVGSIRVLSPGNDGDVTQSNSATAGAAALNGNQTDQSVDQSQAGGAAPSYADEKKPDDKSGSGSDYTQVAGQAASNHQDADADATAVQVKPSNTASSIRVLSPGNDGDVSQSNDATAVGIAANLNKTDQSISRARAVRPPRAMPGSRTRNRTAVRATRRSRARTLRTTRMPTRMRRRSRSKPSNTASSIRVLSPGNGGRRLAVEQHHRDRGGAERQQDGAVRSSRARAVRPPRADARKPDEKSGHGSDVHAGRRPGGFEPPGRRRGCDGGPGEAVQHGVLDPRAQPGQRR